VLVSAGDRAADRVPAEHPGAARLKSLTQAAFPSRTRPFPTIAWAVATIASTFGTIVYLGLVATASCVHAAEICRYAGTTSYSGRAIVETMASTMKGETTVDATAQVSARALGFIDWRYWYEEIGASRDGELRTVAVNHRYSVFGSIRRQLWDVFNLAPDGMNAYRLQAKTLPDLLKSHPGFVRHWDPESFGQPWLPDYQAAAPERRTDLDLPRAAISPGLGTPLVLAFYWVRWAPPDGRDIPVFLPGFKKNARADVRIVSLGLEADGLHHLRSSVRHAQLSDSETSTGDAWVAADHHLVRIAFEARGDHGSARGELRLEGCSGAATIP
jgi:hypothetical protein